ncbi:uncharacterized protein LOC108214242 isoform X3 [Daucus carota subsp. sativus]|uniref:uncharacterized protein LOC108214242 isoform X3 n=1 Tax=Daucus carota subsp. sativus TaxID=79200 RepID=UPI0007EF4947|nr:PREDICTED: uncharacterized protein LOC108214242 isoform X2 [Daucus carota subsp. sativus]
MEKTPTCSPSSSRLWRPAAQRNLRNQWANLSSYKHKWASLSSSARSHATSLVNSSLSLRYMDARDLGVLTDLPGIKNKASLKLFKQQELHRSKLLASYKNMVAIVNQMRLLVIEFFSISNEDARKDNELSWQDELYSGEFDDLSKCNLYSTEACAPLLPTIKGRKPGKLKLQAEHQPDEDVLQVYLTTWLADVNIDKCRVDEILTSVAEEMNVTLV